MTNQIVLTDSCFWIGLLDPSDQYHKRSMVIAELIEEHQVVLPWPCIYETISTRLIRRRTQVILFEQLIKRNNVTLLDDSNYKDAALDQVLFLNRKSGSSHSLTDGVIREILKDPNIRTNYLATFNNRDFQDICQVRSIPILD